LLIVTLPHYSAATAIISGQQYFVKQAVKRAGCADEGKLLLLAIAKIDMNSMIFLTVI
jgi:hypothetical protein